MSTTLFFFRRDHRLEDNTALRKAAENNEEIIPVFCFDPRQLETNEYKSHKAVQFMCESLNSLKKDIEKNRGKLYTPKTKPTQLIERLSEDIDKVRFNKDYTPFSKKRDRQIKQLCEEKGIDIDTSHDAYLTEPGSVKTNKGTTYKVFTPFMKKAKKTQTPPKPQTRIPSFKTTHKIESVDIDSIPQKVTDTIKCRGGRTHAKKTLRNVEEYAGYEEEREYPALDKTTHLSPYLKFGCISPRETYHAFKQEHGEEHGVITELYWRDFYAHLLDSYPKVLNNNMKEKYDAVPWREDKEDLKAWKKGKTGVPIVDAAMRQLTKTGWMHNRCRMITACYLCKDLRIHWKHGEKFFAQHLIDYDPASNNGGWQWAASTGADSQPYFRIFNPWRQQETYDKEAEYIKKYVPELRSLTPKQIHGLEQNKVPGGIDYPEKLVNHKEAAKQTKEVFKQALN